MSEYQRMIRRGVLTEDDRVELLEGWIVTKMPQNPPHAGTIHRAEARIRREIPSGWHVRTQMPVTMVDSEPEPDLSIVRGSNDDYMARHPSPADVGMLGEVSDSTLTDDRILKASIYAREGISVYWILNLVDDQIEVYQDPNGTGASAAYQQKQTCRRGEEVPLVLDGKEIARIPVDDLLP